MTWLQSLKDSQQKNKTVICKVVLAMNGLTGTQRSKERPVWGGQLGLRLDFMGILTNGVPSIAKEMTFLVKYQYSVN